MASRTMVLCVSSVSLSNDKTVNHVPVENANQEDNGDNKLAKKKTEVSFRIHLNSINTYCSTSRKPSGC